MKTALPVAILICILFNYTYSQNSLILQPDAGPGIDVEIFSLEPNNNMDSVLRLTDIHSGKIHVAKMIQQ